MTDADRALIDGLSEYEVVTLTIWAEARGEGLTGMRAVGDVIRNRVKANYGKTLRDVCLAKYQFSCWSPVGGEANFRRLMDAARALSSPELPSSLKDAFVVSMETIGQTRPDSVHGADHYLTRQLFETNPPRWARGETMVAEIGRHVFFRLV